jgi:hypothetical protein
MKKGTGEKSYTYMTKIFSPYKIKIPLLGENSPKFSPYVMRKSGPGENFPRLSLNMIEISICREENSSFFLNTKRFFLLGKKFLSVFPKL